MARKRDVVIGVIIGVAFLLVLVFFTAMMVGMLSGDGEVGLAALGGGAVGVVDMFGVMDEESGRPVIRQLERWKDIDRVKAVVVHVNSPGGGVAIAQEIHAAIERVRETKPVVVSMAGVAASGGYYIACAADRVVANPGTLTGSIGTIMSFHTFEGTMKKLGVGLETIKSGEFKDVGNYSREMTDEEESMLRSVIMDGYEQFVDAVAEGRGMEREEVYTLADGSIYTGLQAYNLGLVDTLGSLYEAVDLAGDLAGIGPEPDILRPQTREKYTIFDLFTGLLGDVNKAVRGTEAGPELMYLYR